MTYTTLRGGLDEVNRGVDLEPGRLIRSRNVECKQKPGYRSLLGYTKYDPNIVPGEGDILGVWGFNGKNYAFRNAVGGATAAMYESTGSGWTAKKTGLVPDGAYNFSNENINGSEMMYGASGVHKLFQWDGTTWTDLTTGMTVDTPDYVLGFKKHLFAASDTDLHNSSLGDATTWAAITGATQIQMETPITGLQRLTGGRLGIWSRNSMGILDGSVAADFVVTNMSQYGNSMGAIAGTLQQLGSRVYFMDDRGVTDFRTAQEFGDYIDATISTDIQPTIESKKDTVVTSVTIKNKTQYRVFFSDKTGIIATFRGHRLSGWTKFQLPLQVTTICNTEDTNGAERIYFGSTDGYIYEMESGSSFDGAAIDSFLLIAPVHLGSPFHSKRFRRAQFDMQAEGVVSIQGKPVFYNRDGPLINYDNIHIDGISGGVLGTMVLGADVLGGSDIVTGVLDTPGVGEYIGIYVSSDAVQSQWEMDGINFQFSMGRRKRN